MPTHRRTGSFGNSSEFDRVGTRKRRAKQEPRQVGRGQTTEGPQAIIFFFFLPALGKHTLGTVASSRAPS